MNLKTTAVDGPWELYDTRWWNLDLGGLQFLFQLLIKEFYALIILRKEGRGEVENSSGQELRKCQN